MMKPIRSTISTSIGLAFLGAPMLVGVAYAEEAEQSATVNEISVVVIGKDREKIAAPVDVIDRNALLDSGAATLGDALSRLPGVQSDTFGGGASRPVIRGQTAPRVKVLADSASVLDASDISPDHAITIDPLQAERIEVLRGPSTLLYGGGAIGGVVNVLDNKIPTYLPRNGMEGRLILRGNTVANENAYGGAISKQVGSNLVVHAEASRRDSGNYRAPMKGTTYVQSTFSESDNASAGLSWVTDSGYIGLAYSQRDDDYGLPGHSHEYESCHPHDSSLHCGDHGSEDGHDHDHEHGDAATVKLKSKRYDLRGEYRNPVAGIAKVRFRSSYTDYAHNELDAGEVATTFTNKGSESRVEVEHVPVAGWTGIVGIQHAGTEFGANGVEAFLPTVKTRTTGVFAVEHFELNDQWHFELGGRHDWVKHTPVNDPRKRAQFDDGANSFSGAVIWSFANATSLTLNVSRSQRLPHVQELYASGVHLATNTYECGLLPNASTCGGSANDAGLSKETAQNVELTLRKTKGQLTYSVGGFVNNVDNYIYARTLDRYENFRLVKYSQQDAKFRGFEAEVGYQINKNLSATVFGDRVQARFADGGGNLPRIAPSRIGTRLDLDVGKFNSELEFIRVGTQKRVADFESPTQSYNLLNMSLAYTLPDGRSRLFLRGTNLLDKVIWNHTSFLAHVVRQPGRNFTAGYSYTF